MCGKPCGGFAGLPSEGKVEYRIAYATCLGVRQSQEDCLFLNGMIVQEEECPVRDFALAGEALLFAVCDGMGGHAMGEWASRFTCERLQNALADPPSTPGEAAALLRDIQVSMEREPPRNCGTTIAGVVLRGTRALIFNAGDSRVYKISPTGVVRMTHDHSLVQTYIDRGEIAPAAAFRHPHRHVIEFGLGEVFAAVWDGGERAVHVVEDDLRPDESCLLCSDGVHDVLEEREIAALCGGKRPAQCAAALEAALRGRMTDNTSFIIVAGR